MTLKYPPYAGQILLCEFHGFVKPEMQKTRPVIVLTPRPISQKTRTAIIVPLSTTAPLTIESYHVPIVLPGQLPSHWAQECWAKCDMLYSVSFSRLGFMKMGKDKLGKRIYYQNIIDHSQLTQIRTATLVAIGK